MVVVAHEAGRLKSVNQFVLLGQLPIERHAVLVVVPMAVEPDGAYLAVVCQELGQLRIHKLVIAGPVRLFGVLACAVSCASCGIVVARPVYVGIVEVELDALSVAGICELAHHILAIGCVHNVIIRLAGVPQGEAIVVARGEADVFRASCLDGTYPFLCIKAVGIEGISSLGIFVSIQWYILHIPFALRKGAVDAPVQEDAKAAVREFLARLQVFLRRFVVGLRLQRNAAYASCQQGGSQNCFQRMCEH